MSKEHPRREHDFPSNDIKLGMVERRQPQKKHYRENLMREELEIKSQQAREFSNELLKFPKDGNLNKFICEKLKVFLDAKFSIFSEYDPETMKLTVVDTEMDETMLKKIVSILNLQVIGVESNVSEKMHKEMMENSIEIDTSLHRITLDAIPELASFAIQALTGTSNFIAISFLVDDSLYGTCLLGLDHDLSPATLKIIDNYISSASIALRNHHSIIAEKKSKEELLYISTHDALSGLLNRRFLNDRIEMIDATDSLATVVFLDVDDLKLINDRSGDHHTEGDQILIETARILEKVCQKRGFAIRLGGDEFAILIEEKISPEEVEEILEEIRKECQKSPSKPGLSIGYAFKEYPDQLFTEVLSYADSAMYKNKLDRKKARVQC